MGADMIVGIVATKKDVEPDFPPGQEFIKKLRAEDLDIDELVTQGLDEDSEEYFDDDGKIKIEGVIQWLLDELDVFQGALNSRATTGMPVRDLHLYITGGMSWGDVGDEAASFWRMGSIPGLLKSMGFVEDWDREEVAVTPEEEAAAITSIKSAAREEG